MRDQIDEYAQRTMRYWYVDGLAEIAGGVIVMLLAAVFLIGGLLPNGTWSDLFRAFGQPAIVIAGAFAARKVVAQVKERVTYPRTGYVAYHRPRGRKRARLIAMSIGVGASFAILFGIIQNMIEPIWVPGISGAVIALLLGYMAYTNGIRRFYLMGLYTLFLGLLVVTLGLAEIYSTPLFFAGFGIGWIISGSLTLNHYLRATRPAAQDG